MGDASSMNNHKVKHIQFIFDDGEYHVLSADNEQRKSAFTELDDLLMCKDLDGFAICITTKFGGRASFTTDTIAEWEAYKIFEERSHTNDNGCLQ